MKLQKGEHKVGGAKGRGGSDRRGLRKRDLGFISSVDKRERESQCSFRDATFGRAGASVADVKYVHPWLRRMGGGSVGSASASHARKRGGRKHRDHPKDAERRGGNCERQSSKINSFNPFETTNIFVVMKMSARLGGQIIRRYKEAG